MRLPLIVCVLVLTAFAFFGATQRIDAEATILERQNAAILQAEIEASRAKFEADTEAYTVQIAELVEKNNERATELLAAWTATAEVETDLQEARATIADTDAAQAALSQENTDLKIQLATLNTESSSLAEALANAETMLADREMTLAEKEAANSELVAAVEEGQSRALALETQLTDLQEQAELAANRVAALENAAPDSASVNDALSGEIADLKSTVIAQEETLAASEVQIADLLAALSEKDATAAERETEIAALQTELEAEIVALKAAASAAVDQEAEVEVTTPAAAPELAIVTECNDRTTAVFARQQITFATGTDAITASSAAVLEGLARVALDCARNDLAVTIAGYADNTGTDAENLALSEDRAAAIRNFLSARGLPGNAMNAVGYNADQQGGEESRAITFAWQQR